MIHCHQITFAAVALKVPDLLVLIVDCQLLAIIADGYQPFRFDVFRVKLMVLVQVYQNGAPLFFGI